MSGPLFHLAEAAAALGVSPQKGWTDRPLAAVATDTRAIEPGALFVALAGPRFDGHDFLAQALEKGAAAAVARMGTKGPQGLPLIPVSDTLRALGDLAAHVRRRRPLRVVALTGSNGKTTTKEMAARILSQKYKTLATSGNFNNLVGLPLTLFGLNEAHEAVVLEMGMNVPGEIARLTEIARPDVGLVTMVGAAHLEGLGSLDGVARAKGELYRGLEQNAVAVVNLDDPFVVREAQEFTGARLGFGFGPEAVVRASAVGFGGLRGARFTLTTPQGSARVGFGLLGRHNVANALAAAAAGSALGIGAEETARALEGFSPFPGRLEPRRLESGIYLIDDTYNANPASMTAALNVLASLRHPRGRLAAVLGDMLELGAASRSEHEGVGRLAGGLGLDLLVTVGSESKALDKASTQGKRPPEKRAWFPDAAEAAQWLEKRVTARDRILVKGSRGMKMERVVWKLAHGEEG